MDTDTTYTDRRSYNSYHVRYHVSGTAPAVATPRLSVNKIDTQLVGGIY